MIDISSYQPCERCKSCEALFICQQCQPLRSFCSKCDTSVHMLPSKKGHQRDSVELMRSRSQFKPKENIDNIPTSYSTLRQSNEQNFMNQERSLVQCPCTLGSSYPQCITSTPRTSYVESKHYEGGRVYTRDYVNELKSIHEKEKEELIFKINALENNLERLKIGFTDQIQKMQNSVEECNRTNFNLIKQNEEEGEAKLKRVIEDKNSQIENTNLRISELKESNEDLLQKIEHVEKQKDKIETKFNKQLKELERELEHKNRQMEKMKSDYNDRIEISEKRNLETRREIREEYEREVNTQRLDFDSEIEMLQRKIEEKNREFKEMVDQKNNDDNYYNKLINELKIDLKFAQEEIKLLISERDDSVTRAQCFEEKAKKLQTENEILNRAIDKHKRGTDDDVAFLENNLNALKRENQILLEHNRKLQYDYEQMMKYDQNSRQLHNENFLLMKENDELRRSLNRCCRCYQ